MRLFVSLGFMYLRYFSWHTGLEGLALSQRRESRVNRVALTSKNNARRVAIPVSIRTSTIEKHVAFFARSRIHIRVRTAHQ